ncbi:hypothetical protein TSAR_001586 [Trichomalopsis sarcophagae]|uniref:Reverse transcriptase domain-containing protein n=1 Tax=Trichomalopsis sarcophagae TaxID=543379 RepID=A0A232ETX7_9HYME|nr:hypothetical protein TSAR_001586 [Trichomalopsis sarcophagae]
MFYANDTQIYRSCKRHDLPDAISKISPDCSANWAAANGLTVNLGKTKAMLIVSSLNISFIKVQDLPTVNVHHCTPIPYMSEAKNLGAWMTSDLGWGPHVSHICQQVFRTLRQLRKNQRALSFGLRKSFVQSLVLYHSSITPAWCTVT